jgi:hypothetical protein
VEEFTAAPTKSHAWGQHDSKVRYSNYLTWILLFTRKLRRSTVASVYSLPSAAPHESRRPTQENYIVDWSVVDRALQNRAESPVASPHCYWPLHEYPHRSSNTSQSHAQRANTCTRGNSASLSRSNTTQVRSLIMDRQQRRDILSAALPE